MLSTLSYWDSVVSKTEVRVSIPAVVHHDVKPPKLGNCGLNQPLQI